jgi:hypothetical protein
MMKDAIKDLTRQLADMQGQLERHGLLQSPSPAQKEESELQDEFIMSNAMIPDETESLLRQVSEGLPEVPLRKSNMMAPIASPASEQANKQLLVATVEEEVDSLAPPAIASPEEDYIARGREHFAHRPGITDKDIFDQKDAIELLCRQIVEELESVESGDEAPPSPRPQGDDISFSTKIRRNYCKAITSNGIHSNDDVEFLRKQMAFKYMSIMDLRKVSDKADSAEFLLRQKSFRFTANLFDDDEDEEY